MSFSDLTNISEIISYEVLFVELGLKDYISANSFCKAKFKKGSFRGNNKRKYGELPESSLFLAKFKKYLPTFFDFSFTEKHTEYHTYHGQRFGLYSCNLSLPCTDSGFLEFLFSL